MTHQTVRPTAVLRVFTFKFSEHNTADSNITPLIIEQWCDYWYTTVCKKTTKNSASSIYKNSSSYAIENKYGFIPLVVLFILYIPCNFSFYLASVYWLSYPIITS